MENYEVYLIIGVIVIICGLVIHVKTRDDREEQRTSSAERSKNDDDAHTSGVDVYVDETDDSDMPNTELNEDDERYAKRHSEEYFLRYGTQHIDGTPVNDSSYSIGYHYYERIEKKQFNEAMKRAKTVAASICQDVSVMLSDDKRKQQLIRTEVAFFLYEVFDRLTFAHLSEGDRRQEFNKFDKYYQAALVNVMKCTTNYAGKLFDLRHRVYCKIHSSNLHTEVVKEIFNYQKEVIQEIIVNGIPSLYDPYPDNDDYQPIHMDMLLAYRISVALHEIYADRLSAFVNAIREALKFKQGPSFQY